MSNEESLKSVLLPQLAESVVTATVAKWLKKPGDSVERYEPICELITDKVTAELPSPEQGIIEQLLVQEGDTIEVGTPLCTVNTRGAVEEAPSLGSSPDVSTDTREETKLQPHRAHDEESSSMRRRYSPAVLHLAQQHNIDLTEVQGTGMNGRITRKDVYAHLKKQEKDQTEINVQSVESSGHKAVADHPVRSTGLHLTPAPAFEVDDRDELKGRGEYLIDVNPVRHAIASRMRQSVTEIPHAWTMVEVDVTNLVMLRNKLKQEFMENEGINLTYLSFVIKAVVNAIKDYPILNSVWAVDKIIVKRDINISLAVGTEDAIYVPVIKQADQKNIAGLAREIDTLTKKARSGKLSPSDIQGGSFTVNNTGSFGSILSQPIINYPQAANLTFEAIVKRPVVINDMIAVRHMSNICLSLDHRILDGVICGRFLQRVKENIEGYTLDTKLY